MHALGPNTTLGCSLCCDAKSHVQITCIPIPKRSYSRINPPNALSGKLHSLQYYNSHVLFHFPYSAIIVKWNFCAARNENVGLGRSYYSAEWYLEITSTVHVFREMRVVYARGKFITKSLEYWYGWWKLTKALISPDVESRDTLLMYSSLSSVIAVWETSL
jgi:hypothetical protein